MKTITPTKLVKYKGLEIKVYSVIWLGALCQRSRDTILRWERMGILPRPVLSTPDKFRWYSSAELLGYSEIFKRANVRRKVPIQSTDFRRNAQHFRNELRENMQLNPAILGTILSSEAALRSSLVKQRSAQ